MSCLTVAFVDEKDDMCRNKVVLVDTCRDVALDNNTRCVDSIRRGDDMICLARANFLTDDNKSSLSRTTQQGSSKQEDCWIVD